MKLSPRELNRIVSRNPYIAARMQLQAEKRYGKLPSRLDSGMNKSEAAYADHLARLRIVGEIISYEWTGKNRERSLMIGARRRYTPDFYVWPLRGPVEYHEVKGYLRDGGSIRFDLAAEKHHGNVFRMVRRTRNGWEEMRTRNVV